MITSIFFADDFDDKYFNICESMKIENNDLLKKL